MSSKIMIASIMTVTMLASSAAFAQGYGHQDNRGRNEQMQRGAAGHDRGSHGSPHNKHDGRHDNRRPMQHDGRGAGPNHSFYKGGRIPHEYRNRQYVVNDWRGHHLHAPPRGYQWVQTGPDYVLIAIASGIIVQIVLGN